MCHWHKIGDFLGYGGWIGGWSREVEELLETGLDDGGAAPDTFALLVEVFDTISR